MYISNYKLQEIGLRKNHDNDVKIEFEYDKFRR